MSVWVDGSFVSASAAVDHFQVLQMSHGTEIHSFKSQLKIQVATHPSFPADSLAMTHKTRLVMYPDETQCLLVWIWETIQKLLLLMKDVT